MNNINKVAQNPIHFVPSFLPFTIHFTNLFFFRLECRVNSCFNGVFLLTGQRHGDVIGRHGSRLHWRGDAQAAVTWRPQAPLASALPRRLWRRVDGHWRTLSHRCRGSQHASQVRPHVHIPCTFLPDIVHICVMIDSRTTILFLLVAGEWRPQQCDASQRLYTINSRGHSPKRWRHMSDSSR